MVIFSFYYLEENQIIFLAISKKDFKKPKTTCFTLQLNTEYFVILINSFMVQYTERIIHLKIITNQLILNIDNQLLKLVKSKGKNIYIFFHY